MSHNSTVCRKHEAPKPPPVLQDGDFNFQTHHIGFILCGTFAIISTVVSVWLISKHLRWYTNKREQRYIVRLLFMVPLYALISFASFYFWNQSTPIVLVRDSYEAIVLTAFFYLLLMYLSDDPEEQKRIFLKKGLSREADRTAEQRGLPVEKWCFPLGFVKWKPSDGLYFLQLMKWAVLQYCVIRPTTTLAAVILDLLGLYCESSWNLRWGHAYIVIIISVSVSIAMYCLVQLYIVVAAELAPYKPLLKLFSIKAVVFLTFWQATFLSVLSMVGVIKDTEYMTAEDINIGIGAVIETFEMMLFAFLHIRAFTYKPYKEIAVRAAKGRPPTPTPRWKSLGHAMDFRETFRELWIGCVYLFDKMRGKEPKPDFGARRIAHYEIAFGRSRVQQGHASLPLRSTKGGDKHSSPPAAIAIEQEVSVELEGHKQFLGLSTFDRYGVHPHREKSEGLEDQINQELQRLGYPKLTTDLDLLPESKSAVPKLPWWRTLYGRLSQSGQDADLTAERESFIPRRLSNRFSRQIPSHRQRTDMMREQRMGPNRDIDLDDDPPPISLRFPPSRVSPRRDSTSSIQDHGPGTCIGMGQGHWREQDRSLLGNSHRPTSSLDVMIDCRDPPATFSNRDGVDGTRTAYTERPDLAPNFHYHHSQLNRNFNSNFGDHDQRQPFRIPSHSPLEQLSRSLQKQSQQQVEARVHYHDQIHDRVQTQAQPISSPTPRGALVFPPLESAHPAFEMNNPNYRSDTHPRPPPLPPKDVAVLPSRHGEHARRKGTLKSNTATAVPHRRSTHRREPASPYSPSPAPVLPDPTGISGLPAFSEHDTNRHADIYEPCNDSS